MPPGLLRIEDVPIPRAEDDFLGGAPPQRFRLNDLPAGRYTVAAVGVRRNSSLALSTITRGQDVTVREGREPSMLRFDLD